MYKKFKAKWLVEDGYAGPEAPHYAEIHASDLYRDMSEGELLDFFWDCIRESFNQTVTFTSDDEAAFLEWAAKAQAERDSDAVD